MTDLRGRLETILRACEVINADDPSTAIVTSAHLATLLGAIALDNGACTEMMILMQYATRLGLELDHKDHAPAAGVEGKLARVAVTSRGLEKLLRNSIDGSEGKPSSREKPSVRQPDKTNKE